MNNHRTNAEQLTNDSLQTSYSGSTPYHVWYICTDALPISFNVVGGGKYNGTCQNCYIVSYI